MKSTPTIEQLSSRIDAIEQRNRRVEFDKAWEGSLTRKTAIMAVTYLVVVTFLIVIEKPEPFINALVPVIGFYLSTLVVSRLKKYWIRQQERAGK